MKRERDYVYVYESVYLSEILVSSFTKNKSYSIHHLWTSNRHFLRRYTITLSYSPLIIVFFNDSNWIHYEKLEIVDFIRKRERDLETRSNNGTFRLQRIYFLSKTLRNIYLNVTGSFLWLDTKEFLNFYFIQVKVNWRDYDCKCFIFIFLLYDLETSYQDTNNRRKNFHSI